jgi:hypothetical protein
MRPSPLKMSCKMDKGATVMHVHRVLLTLVALAIAAPLSALAIAGTASAKPKPQILVKVSPNPLIETGVSEVHGVVQVEANPAYAGMSVDIESEQLELACSAVYFAQNSGYTESVSFGLDNPAVVTLDADGNATVELDAYGCPPERFLLEADLVKAPYYTATTILKVKSPVKTTPGLTGYPNPEVETGDGTFTGSNVYAVFYVEMPVVDAEGAVAISSPQLQGRCLSGFEWEAGNTGYPPTHSTSGGVTTTLDDDGNAVFIFEGISCAAGSSTVTADLLSGGASVKTKYVIDSPAPTV